MCYITWVNDLNRATFGTSFIIETSHFWSFCCMGGLNTVTVGYAGCQEATGFAVGVPVTKSWTAWNNWWNICSSSWLPGSNDGLVEESGGAKF